MMNLCTWDYYKNYILAASQLVTEEENLSLKTIYLSTLNFTEFFKLLCNVFKTKIMNLRATYNKHPTSWQIPTRNEYEYECEWGRRWWVHKLTLALWPFSVLLCVPIYFILPVVPYLTVHYLTQYNLFIVTWFQKKMYLSDKVWIQLNPYTHKGCVMSFLLPYGTYHK
jgi:hypothetical protein